MATDVACPPFLCLGVHPGHLPVDLGTRDGVDLRANYVCGYIRLCVEPNHEGTKCHYLLRFYLTLVL